VNANLLAAFVLLVASASFLTALLVSRRILAHRPTIGRGLATVVVWTGFFGSLPYVVFVAAHATVKARPLGAFASIVLGLLPFAMLSAPVIALVMVLRQYARFMKLQEPSFPWPLADRTEFQMPGDTDQRS